MRSGSRISNSSASVSGSAKAADKPTWLAIWTVPAAPKRPSACRLSSFQFCSRFCCFKGFFICLPLLLQPDCRCLISIGFPNLDCDIGKIWWAKQSAGIV